MSSHASTSYIKLSYLLQKIKKKVVNQNSICYVGHRGWNQKRHLCKHFFVFSRWFDEISSFSVGISRRNHPHKSLKTFRLQGSMTASYYWDNRTDQSFQHEDQGRRQAVPESGTKDNSALKPRKTTETITTTSSSSSSFGWSRPGSTTPRGHSPTCVRLFFCVLRTGEIVPWTF